MPRQQRVNHDFSIGELKDRRNGSRARPSYSVVARMYFLPKALASTQTRQRRGILGPNGCLGPNDGKIGAGASAIRLAADEPGIEKALPLLHVTGPGPRGNAERRQSGGMSHIRIIRPAPAFGRNPSYVLVRVFDVTGFTVNTVLRINHEAGLAGFLNPFINGRRAVTCRRSGIDVVLGRFLQSIVAHQ